MYLGFDEIPKGEEITIKKEEKNMTEENEININTKPKTKAPILQLNRMIYVKVGGKILNTTGEKLNKYIAYATEQMNTEITKGDVIEHGLKLLFDRDSGFKNWLKQN